MTAIGRKSIIDQLLEALRTAGVSVSIRTKALDFPMMGVLVDLGMKGCLRTDAVPPVSRVLAATDEEKGVCTVALYAFHEADQYSESCMVWGNAVTLYSPTPDMEDRRRKTDGRIFIRDCGSNGYLHLRETGSVKTGDMKEAIRAIRDFCLGDGYPDASSDESFCVAVAEGHRGIVEGPGPYVMWADGRGTVLPICPRTPMPSIGELALGDKGLCLRALRNGFQVWTDDDSKAWVVPGTKDLSRIPKTVMQEIMDGKEGPSPMKRIAGTI